ncbi:DNA-directed DNA polymerase [Thermaerobacter marianensis DSM 12885]|uniref:DNA polymerase IV n=1 Tax=Thermaerobacter marianensis (strain ATCC 700841 / DSM 12885 / JCM 10246 / 7p75a) TaxID=644966 RepID=E6SKT9_THEM7|nr:DNA polymerase IV [Thermaerobacter marianensis]ADU52312.1 DNA-directed DNA polymerase [Thermaerobacter marianensis DSM 12885]
MDRWVLHCDLDAFFAAVEQLDRPELRGRPVIVGGDPASRGVVATCSYEARAFGVRSAMPLAQARRLCPHAVFLPVRRERYEAVSRQVMAILARESPVLEPVSIDEAYLEVRGDGVAAARRLREAVRREVGLAMTVGVGPNRLVAKMACQRAKPDGLLAVAPAEVEAWLAPQPVEALPGLGPVTAARLRQAGIATLGQLAAADPVVLHRLLKGRAAELQARARGWDPRPVGLVAPARSLSEERTFPQDRRAQDVLPVLAELCEELGGRLRRQGYEATQITLKVRYADFTTVTRSRTLPRPACADGELFAAARELLARHVPPERWLRLVGVAAGGLIHQHDPQQLALWPGDSRSRRLAQAVDQVRGRFGRHAIGLAARWLPGAATGTGQGARRAPASRPVARARYPAAGGAGRDGAGTGPERGPAAGRMRGLAPTDAAPGAGVGTAPRTRPGGPRRAGSSPAGEPAGGGRP